MIRKGMHNAETLLRGLLRKRFVRNIITVASGTMMAQAIMILFSPIITRIYGPEAFGVLGVFTSIVAIANPIVAFTYPIAIVLPSRDSDAKQLVRLSLRIAMITSTILAMILVFLREQILALLQVEVLRSYLLFIPVTMFFSACLQVMQQWVIRKEQFIVRAKVASMQALIVNVSKIGVGLLYPSATTLVVITTLGNGLQALMLAVGSKIPLGSLRNSVRRDDTSVTAVARDYRDFPVYRAPEVFVNAISKSLPVLMLTSFFGPSAAGFYSIGKRVLDMPATLIGNSIGDVYYPRIAKAANVGGDITLLLKKSSLTLALMGVVPFGIVALFGPLLFRLVFGTGWSIAGEYARWISLWSFFAFVAKPSVKTLPVIGAQRFHLFFSIVTVVSRLLALVGGSYVVGSDVVSIALYSLVGVCLNLLLVFITIRKSAKWVSSREASCRSLS
jgi:O-antigen/teichoic acid export membrane protein